MQNSNKPTNADKLKKTFRITATQQEIMTHLMNRHDFNTESAFFIFMLESYEDLEVTIRKLRTDLALSRNDASHKAGLIRRFNAIIADLADEQPDTGQTAKQPLPLFHKIDEEE